MTGFGTATAAVSTKKITADIKSLNSKQLDLNCRISQGVRQTEPEIRRMVARIVERGKIDLSVTIENTGCETASRLNAEAIAEYKRQIEEVAVRTGLPCPTDWYGVLLRMPDTVKTSTDEGDPAEVETVNAAVLDAVGRALAALMDYRRAEGVKLEEFFTVRIENIRNLLAQVPRYENERVEKIRARLFDALSNIPNVEFDKGRLEQEMIYYIEKLDVSEEKQRLSQHLDYFVDTMNEPGFGHGKKLGFIAQEMSREINTLGSKSNHAEMQNLVVMMKDELEQIKEQVLNVM